MATTVVQTAITRIADPRPVWQLVIGWAVLLPLIFFAVHGSFSFEGGGNNVSSNAGSLSGLASPGHSPGFIGYVVFPGIAYSVVFWLILKNAGRILALSMQMKMITLLSLLTVCSALWSQDPFRSAYNGTLYIVETLFAFYLVLKFDAERMASMAMMVGAVLAGFGLVMALLFPQFGTLYNARDGLAWQGLFSDRSAAAKCLVFLLSPALTLHRRPFRYRHALYIALMSLMIFMAHAMTARVVLLGYVIFMALLRVATKFGRRSALLVGGGLLLGLGLIAFVSLPWLPLALQGLGRNATLSGRTGIWSAVLISVAKRPLLGYGFYAFWRGLTGESASLILRSNWVFGYAHNGVLEICLQLGLLGAVVFFATLFQAIRNAWFCVRNGCPPGVEWYAGVIVLTIMYNVDESTVLWPIELLSILYIVACCGLAMAARRLKFQKQMEALYS
jgi:exopolysaccharide production protein ExoQ